MKDRRKKPRNSDDRRNNNRVFAEIDVVAFVNDEKFSTKMRNISGNGMQITEPADIEMQPEQECKIIIKDESTTIKLDASVVWKEFGLIGLCFKKQNQRIQKQINKLSQRLLMISLTDKGMAGLV
jgi:PilZ domain-containing protein